MYQFDAKYQQLYRQPFETLVREQVGADREVVTAANSAVVVLTVVALAAENASRWKFPAASVAAQLEPAASVSLFLSPFLPMPQSDFAVRLHVWYFAVASLLPTLF